MTPAQRADAVLFRELGRPAEAISANTGIPVEIVKAWLRTGRWPKSTQKTLFDAGDSTRETNQPAIATGRNSGLIHFSRAD